MNTFLLKGRFALLFPEPRLNENLPWKEVASNSSLYHVDHLARESEGTFEDEGACTGMGGSYNFMV